MRVMCHLHALQEMPQLAPCRQLHDHVKRAVLLKDLVKTDNVWVVQGPQDLDLATQTNKHLLRHVLEADCLYGVSRHTWVMKRLELSVVC